jgi:hypothetical protein
MRYCATRAARLPSSTGQLSPEQRPRLIFEAVMLARCTDLSKTRGRTARCLKGHVPASSTRSLRGPAAAFKYLSKPWIIGHTRSQPRFAKPVPLALAHYFAFCGLGAVDALKGGHTRTGALSRPILRHGCCAALLTCKACAHILTGQPGHPCTSPHLQQKCASALTCLDHPLADPSLCVACGF